MFDQRNGDILLQVQGRKQGATLEQLVAALRFILSAPALTGEVITIDGGQSLQGMPRDVSFLAED